MSDVFKIILAALVAAVLYGFGVVVGLDPKQSLLLGMVGLLITLWTNEGLPLGVTSLLPLLLFPLMGLNGLKQVAQNYSHPIIFLFLGGFLLALGFEKTRLHLVVAHKMIAIFPPTLRGKIYAVMVTSALLSSVLSNTTITLMLMPIVISLVPHREDIEKEKGEYQTLISRFLLAIAFGASIGGVLTPIGTPPNLILIGFLQQNNLEPFSFTGWIFRLLPVVTIMLLVVPYFLSAGLKDKDFGMTGKDLGAKRDSEIGERLDRPQKKVTTILLLLVGLLLANSRYGDFYPGLGISETSILLGFGLLLFLPGIGVLEWEDTIKIPWEIIFLFGAGFAIANTIIERDLPVEIIKHIQGIETLPLIVLIFLISLSVSLCTEVTSNTAFIAIALPVLYQVCLATGLDARLILPVATVATSYAFTLPIATPPNAIIMSSRMIKVKTMIRYGLVTNMIGVIVLTVVAYFLW